MRGLARLVIERRLCRSPGRAACRRRSSCPGCSSRSSVRRRPCGRCGRRTGRRLQQAGAHPSVGHLGELQIRRVAGDSGKAAAPELGRRRGRARCCVRCFRHRWRTGCRPGTRAPAGLPAGHLERHDPLGAPQRAAACGSAGTAARARSRSSRCRRSTSSRPVRPAARRCRRMRPACSCRCLPRLPELFVSRYVVQAHAAATAVRRDRRPFMRGDVRHAHGRRKRLRERPQVGERFARVQAGAG